MNLKKNFIIELVTGILVVVLYALTLNIIPSIINSVTGSFIFLALYFIYNQILYRKQKECSETEKQIIRKAGIVNGVIIGIPLFILLMNFKNPQPDYINHFHNYFGYYFVMIILFVHSLAGLAILKYYEKKK